ncbi:cysteine-rich receptor-like protein kinase [Trifolium medium]|uniref:Cysteine-rich receptor-like protein kinase n=1 Tax=Trifolium medium TaxID=97028 RepID=A0A392SC81_9FABA|nr:cysteine-rich receptor-like protein kinase [Trifolium medium]
MFWDDPWLGEGIVLRERFPRLTGLSSEPGISVGALYRRGWGVGGAGWSWRHQLFAWEEECC